MLPSNKTHIIVGAGKLRLGRCYRLSISPIWFYFVPTVQTRITLRQRR